MHIITGNKGVVIADNDDALEIQILFDGEALSVFVLSRNLEAIGPII